MNINHTSKRMSPRSGVIERDFKSGPIERLSKELGRPRGTHITDIPRDDLVLSQTVSLRNGVQLSSDYLSSRVAVTGLGGLTPLLLDAVMNVDIRSGEFNLSKHLGPSQTVRSDGTQTLRSFELVTECHQDGRLEAREQGEAAHPWGTSDPVVEIRECAVRELDDGVFAFADSLSKDGTWNAQDSIRKTIPFLTRQEMGLENGPKMSGPLQAHEPLFVSTSGELLKDGRDGWTTDDDREVTPRLERLIEKVVQDF